VRYWNDEQTPATSRSILEQRTFDYTAMIKDYKIIEDFETYAEILDTANSRVYEETDRGYLVDESVFNENNMVAMELCLYSVVSFDSLLADVSIKKNTLKLKIYANVLSGSVAEGAGYIHFIPVPKSVDTVEYKIKYVSDKRFDRLKKKDG